MIESITNADIAPNRSGRTFLIGLLIALLLTAGVGGGMFLLQRRNAAKLALQQKAATPSPKPKPSPQLQVSLDEAQIKSGQAALSGTVKNISANTISGISLDLQLFHREGNAVEVRTLVPVPNELPPNGEAKYELVVPQKDFRTMRVLRISSTSGGSEIAFVTALGAKRPQEGPVTITQTVGGPGKTKGSGEVFSNTPDTPERIP